LHEENIHAINWIVFSLICPPATRNDGFMKPHGARAAITPWTTSCSNDWKLRSNNRRRRKERKKETNIKRGQLFSVYICSTTRSRASNIQSFTMKLILLANCCLASLVAAAGKETLYLIRHGEKPSTGNGLSAQGVQRSQCLRTVFGRASSYNIGHIMAQTPQSGKYNYSLL
jgi:hypothetical protein